MQVLVIGAGIAGLTTAYYLQRNGFVVSVLERDSTISNTALQASAEQEAGQLFNAVYGCIRFESEVTGFNTVNDLIGGVVVGEQLLRADYYVLAAGKGSHVLLHQLGIRYSGWCLNSLRLKNIPRADLGRCAYANLLLNTGSTAADWTTACAWAQYLTDLLLAYPAALASGSIDSSSYR